LKFEGCGEEDELKEREWVGYWNSDPDKTVYFWKCDCKQFYFNPWRKMYFPVKERKDGEGITDIPSLICFP
jgi:hypothetical protein